MSELAAALFGALVPTAVAVVVLRRRPQPPDETTARREAEERARRRGRERSQLKRALRAIPIGVVVEDVAGVRVFENNAARQFTTARHSDATVAIVLDRLLAEARQGAADDATVEVAGPPSRTIVVRALPIYKDGEPIGAVGLTDDVTELARLETIRRDFVANISHELRTPIGALGVLAEAIAADPSGAHVGDLAERLVTEAFRVARMVEDLTELSRVEHDRTDAPHTRLRCDELVAEAVARSTEVARAAGITVEVADIAADLAVDGDRRQLVSALFNLVENAVKYSEQGAAVDVTAVAEGTEVVIEVIDHGIGIPAADLERVFERFYRVDAARSRSTGGTGLGLAIVRHVVENHGGAITVRSRSGEGSTFTLRLPRAA